jgi:hypothetical protein
MGAKLREIGRQLLQWPPTATTVHGIAWLGALGAFEYAGGMGNLASSLAAALTVLGLLKVIIPDSTGEIVKVEDRVKTLQQQVAAAPPPPLASRPPPTLGVMLAVGLAGLGLSGCAQLDGVAARLTPAIVAFEAKAAPAIARGCADFRQAEASPTVQLAIGAGTVAIGAATAGVGSALAGAGVSLLRSFGDRFCTEGPPAGDMTSEADRAVWIADVAAKMLAAAGAR